MKYWVWLIRVVCVGATVASMWLYASSEQAFSWIWAPVAVAVLSFVALMWERYSRLKREAIGNPNAEPVFG